MVRQMRLAMSLALTALGLSSIGSAVAAPKLIASCPTTISAPGLYEVKSNLTASGTCITVAAANVVLGLAANITGNGTGIGIHIVGANAVVRADGNGRTVSGFNVGVEDDKGGSIIGDFNVGSNTTGLLLRGSSATATIIDDVQANGNAQVGISVTSAAGVRADALAANNNGSYGIQLAATSKNSLLANLSAENNGTTDIDIAGSSNVIYGCTVMGGQYGLVAEPGATNNAVVACGHGNGAPPSIEEALDRNGQFGYPSCGPNLWFNNSFSANHSPGCTGAAVVGTPISKCQTIGVSGAYYLANDITSNSGDCLIVTTKGVTLNLNEHLVTGSGAGIGLHVTRTATNFRALSGGDHFANFKIGIELDANGATIEGTGGSNNAEAGIYVNGASGVNIGELGDNNNGNYGLYLVNASRVLAHNFSANSNGIYGVFVDHSNDNFFDQFTAGNGGANGIAGFYIGCSTTGPSAACKKVKGLGNVATRGTGALNKKYGWVVDTGSDQNILININAGGNPTDDMYDGNAHCAHNLWVFDAFGSSNDPGCLE